MEPSLVTATRHQLYDLYRNHYSCRYIPCSTFFNEILIFLVKHQKIRNIKYFICICL